MKKNKKIILILINYYLPGYQSGGPIRSIANLVENLGNEFEIKIICRDHDFLDKKPYQNINIDSWNKIGKAKVFYASIKTLNFKGLKKILNQTKHDLLYLNSFFSFKFSILPIFLRKFGFIKNNACIIAPRGEFSDEALKLKLIKKSIFLIFAKFLGLYDHLFWQASSIFEKSDILRNFKNIKKKSIFIAPNFISNLSINLSYNILRKPGPTRFVFLSSILPMKNLDFLLVILHKVNVPIDFTIYGPKKNSDYLKKCLKLIDTLPKNIKVSFKGEVHHQKVQRCFSKYDLFVFPTRGENFGHAIFESLCAGTPVLISNKTPWRGGANGALNVLELDEVKWIKAISFWSKLNNYELNKRRKSALKFARSYINSKITYKKNKDFFNYVLNNTIKNKFS